MITDTDNLMFANVYMPILDKAEATAGILALPDNVSFWDDYRYTKMIPLMTKQGQGSLEGASNLRPGEFTWLDYTPTVIKDWFEDCVFPWAGTRARVMALITQPGVSNYEHIDCEPNELNTRQHKFRIVLQGQTDTLYFKTTKGDIPAPNVEVPFVMDGGWPHGMTNTGTEAKVTLAMGAPWIGNDEYRNIDILMDRRQYTMPKDLTKYWKTPIMVLERFAKPSVA
jgi:hypothetical protein